MKKEEKRICSRCGQEIVGEFVEVDGEIVCQNCFDEYYFYCDDCGEIEERDNGYWIECESKLVCQNCINDYTYCNDCGEYFPSDDTYYVEGHGYCVCRDCRDSGDYYYCNGCNELFHIDDLTYSERYDGYYCDSCYDDCCDDDDLLYEYHDFNDWYFYKGSNEESYDKVPYYIGKEIELEPKKYSNVEGVVNAINNNINAVGMHDGSLDEGGVEVVTHPESWEYLKEHKENYRKFFEEIEGLNYGDAGNTGLHFHVTRPNDNVISRVIVILESFKEEIKKLSRRNGDFHWSKFLSDKEQDNADKLKYQSTKYLKEKYITSFHDRYVALNLNNDNTIEFRFFNGANNFEEFWGALQFIHNLMELALDESRELNTIEWGELLYGDELIEQAIKTQVLGINKKAKDTSEIVEKIEKLKGDTKEEIRKTLKNFIKYMTRQLENKKLEIINKNDIDSIERTGTDFVNNLKRDLDYLHTLVQLYNRVNDYSLKSIKSEVNFIKDFNENNKNRYSNYFKQIDKTFNKFESEVNE